jgi:hypothetical protein
MAVDTSTTHSYEGRNFIVQVGEVATGFLVSVIIAGIGGQKGPYPYRNRELAENAGILLARGLINAARASDHGGTM